MSDNTKSSLQDALKPIFDEQLARLSELSVERAGKTVLSNKVLRNRVADAILPQAIKLFMVKQDLIKMFSCYKNVTPAQVEELIEDILKTEATEIAQTLHTKYAPQQRVLIHDLITDEIPPEILLMLTEIVGGDVNIREEIKTLRRTSD
jgi:predicted Zn-dependent peptidase